MSPPPFSRTRHDGTFRDEVHATAKEVRLERTCTDSNAREFGQAGYEEFSHTWKAAEFLASSEARRLVLQHFDVEGLNEVLAVLGAPPVPVPVQQRAVLAEALPPRPGPGEERSLVALRYGWAKLSQRVRYRAGALGNGAFMVAVVGGLWAVLAFPGWSLLTGGVEKLRHARALASPESQVQGTVVEARSLGLVTHAVGGKGSSSPLRRYEGRVTYRYTWAGAEREARDTVTAPDIVKGQAVLDERLAAYRVGGPVALRCEAGAPDACVLDDGGEVGFWSWANAIAMALFGLFLMALVPGLLAFGLWLGARG